MSSRTGRPARPLPVHGGTPGLVRPVRIGKNYLDSTEVPTLGVHTDDLLGRRAERETVTQLLDQARVRSQRDAGGARGSRHRQDSARRARPRPRAPLGVPGGVLCRSGVRDPVRVRRSAPAVRAAAGPRGCAARAAAGRPLAWRSGCAPVPHRTGSWSGSPTLNLLAEVAEEAPLLCLVDDAQWLDEASAQVLAFVARRVDGRAGGAALRAARHRRGQTITRSPGCPSCAWKGSSETDARTLLAAAVHTPLDDAVSRADRRRGARQPAGAAGAPPRHPRRTAGRRVRAARCAERSTPRRGQLPAPLGRLAGRHAAAAVGRRGRSDRRRRRCCGAPPRGSGIDREAAAPAEAAGLLEIDTRVRFRHPLVRSAVYRAATPPDHRRAHAALAAATDPQSDPDRRAWHQRSGGPGHRRGSRRGAGALGRPGARPRRAGRRGRVPAARGPLTPDPATRARRALEAAHAKHDAGASDAALELLDGRGGSGRWTPCSTRVSRCCDAQIAFHLTREQRRSRDAAGRRQDVRPAGRRAVPRDLPTCARCGDHQRRERRGCASPKRPSAAPPPGVPTRPVDLLLDGLATTLTRGYAAGAPGLRLALEAFRDGPQCGRRARPPERPLAVAGRLATRWRSSTTSCSTCWPAATCSSLVRPARWRRSPPH